MLKPMTDEKIEELIDVVCEYNDMQCFIVKNSPRNQLVLKEKKESTSKEIRILCDQTKQYYREYDYENCINTALELMSFFPAPRAWLYMYAGLSYAKIGNRNKAYTYLFMSTYMSQKYENGTIDFTELLCKLKKDHKGITDFEVGRKAKVIMDETEFTIDSFDNYYGLSNFEDINNYILEKGIDINEASHDLNLSDEDVALLNLIYARLFFMESSFEYGEKFLKSYLKSPNKTDKTNKIYQDILNRKKFLVSTEELPVQLSLKMIPR